MQRKLKTPRKKRRGVCLKMFFLGTGILVGPLLAAEPLATRTNASLTLWQDSPIDPTLVAQRDKGITRVKGNEKIQWDVWGFAIGNGRLGAVFYGNVAKELVQFNEDSLWTGGDTKKVAQKPGSKVLRDLNYGSYQPFGDLLITLPHTEFTEYRRELDISRAVGTVTYKSAGVTYRREYFASYPDQVILVRLSADKPESITANVGLVDRHFGNVTTADGKTITMRGKLDENLYLQKGFSELAFGTPEQIASAKFVFAGNNMRYEAQVRVIVEGGTVTAGEAGEIKVVGANSALIILAADTDYLPDSSKNWRGQDPHLIVTKQIEAASQKPYEELWSRHLSDYQALFNRLQLDLGKSDSSRTSLPMDKRLEAYRKEPMDPELVALITQFGRYLLISCSRPGSLPANLQGLWNPNRIFAPWSADYHLNINLQMNYWLTGAGNLSECDEPLFHWMRSIMPVLKRETQAEFGARGWAAGWALNLFGGGFLEKKVEGAWLCMHLFEHYRFTHDKKMLAEVTFPMIRDAVYFWEDSLIEKNGTLMAPQVSSPEWGPTEDGVLYAQELLWELFTGYIESADILGSDRAHRDKIAALRDKLAWPKIGRNGEVMEWQSEQPKSWNKEHRHVSHLVGLYPGRQISTRATPELAKAAAVTLSNRGMGSTGWGKTHRAALWARLHRGEEAMNLVKAFIQIHIWPSGLSCINAGDKFQIDANLGLPAAIFEMLLQSHNNELVLLPALPSEFTQGSVQGIRGRDGFLVDLSWKNGQLTQAVIHSTLGGSSTVRYGGKAIPLDIKAGESVVLTKDLWGSR